MKEYQPNIVGGIRSPPAMSHVTLNVKTKVDASKKEPKNLGKGVTFPKDFGHTILHYPQPLKYMGQKKIP